MAASSLQETLKPLSNSRKLLVFPTWHPSSAATATPPGGHDHFSRSTMPKSTLDANVIMVISVLFCALICSFCFNSIVRCALRCINLISAKDSGRNNLTEARLANTGLKKQALMTFPVVNYSGDLKFLGLHSECAICLSEFASGELIRVLPKCSHGFHVECIDRWLNSHSSCPTCRHCLIEVCQKSEPLGGTTAPPGLPRETNLTISPLEPEGFVNNRHRL